MKTKTLGKLMFSGVAAGVALGFAIVFATSDTAVVKPQSTAKTDRLVVETGVEPRVDAKSDRLAIIPSVVRSTKTDALDLTLALLRGSDIDTPEEPVDVVLTAPAPVEAETPGEDPAASTQETAVVPVDETAILTVTPRQVVTSPATQRTAVTAQGDPINIVPSPEPVESTPVNAPSTTTNFTTDPTSSADTLRDRTDLVR